MTRITGACWRRFGRVRAVEVIKLQEHAALFLDQVAIQGKKIPIKHCKLVGFVASAQRDQAPGIVRAEPAAVFTHS